MARIFTTNINSPIGMNKAMNEQRVRNAGIFARGLGNGIGEIGNGIARELKYYDDATKREDELDYIAQRRSVEDADYAEDRDYLREERQNKRNEAVNDAKRRADAIAQLEAYEASVDDALKNGDESVIEEYNFLKSPEYRQAREQYVNGNYDAILEARQRKFSNELAIRNVEANEKLLEQQKKDKENEKAAAEAESKTKAQLFEDLKKLDIGTMTDNQVVNMDDKERVELMDKLQIIKQASLKNGFIDIVGEVDKNLERLQRGKELLSGNESAQEKKKKRLKKIGG